MGYNAVAAYFLAHPAQWKTTEEQNVNFAGFPLSRNRRRPHTSWKDAAWIDAVRKDAIPASAEAGLRFTNPGEAYNTPGLTFYSSL